MEWEWLLIGSTIVLVILVHIRSFIVLSQFKEKRIQMLEDTEAIHQSMEEFVTNLEKENDELYRELVQYIRTKESKLEDRIRVLEEKLAFETHRAPVVEAAVAKPEEEKQAEVVVPHEDESQNEHGHDKISQLYKQGFSAKQISKILQIDHGEVELVINMYKIKQSYHK
jgi:flagellar basal body-associated protein FliL